MRFVVTVFCLSLFLSFQSGDESSLTIKVDNIKELKGRVYIAVIAEDKAKGFPEDRDSYYEYAILEVDKDAVSTTLRLPIGKYALSILHDLNGNAKMDKNFFGIPEEPYGFSNNFKPLVSAPDFNDCVFEVAKGMNHQSISLIH